MRTKLLKWIPIAILFVAVTFAFSSMPAVNAADDETKVLESYGKLPLSFIENKGQVDEEVSYYLNGRDGTIYFTKEAVVYDLLSANASLSNEEMALWYLAWYLNISKTSSYNRLISKGENKNGQN